MSNNRSRLGQEIENALGEVLAHVKGETVLHTYEVTDVDVGAIRKATGLSRPKFAKRFGLDARAVQDWEQGRRRPDRTARVLLKVIQRDPDAVVRALAAEDRA